MRRRSFIFALATISLLTKPVEASLFDNLKKKVLEALGWGETSEPTPPQVDLDLKPKHKPHPDLPMSPRFQAIRERMLPVLTQDLADKTANIGDPVFLRILKLEAELELWMQPKSKDHFELIKTFKICNFSGNLGPKLKEGDRQSPEGFYQVFGSSLNPSSSFHLSFNLGFPNPLERSLDRTGSFLMVHGDCQSIGCYAMTDEGIEPIYTLVYEALAAALRRGEEKPYVAVHAFPFRMDTEQHFEAFQESPWIDFWRNLQEGYLAFQREKRIPQIDFADGLYVIKSEVT